MGIKSIKRKERITEVLDRKGGVSVAELVSMLKVSEVTVRRYLEELEKENVLLRTYGGAVKKEGGISPEFFFGEKEKKNLAAKKAIAAESIALIKSGETIFLDTGTTTLEISRLLAGIEKKLIVVTNSLPVVSELSQSSVIKVFVLGGFLRRELMDFSGPFSDSEIKGLAFDQIFLGVDGISAEKGLTTTDTTTAKIEEAVMSRTRIINIAADFSKIGKISLIQYGDINKRNIHKRLITDSSAEKKEVSLIKKLGFEIKIAELQGIKE
ncbi:MAG: DeoR/GlpR transcriptional regulator [Candidatus Omnitrophica bacterium]|nr:DeoR/GlpR transcriptional regulator [Candidatus Omnitrophota bacterium]